MSSEKNVLNFCTEKRKKNPVWNEVMFLEDFSLFYVGNVYICFSFLRTFLQ